jgi:hypothetical protein
LGLGLKIKTGNFFTQKIQRHFEDFSPTSPLINYTSLALSRHLVNIHMGTVHLYQGKFNFISVGDRRYTDTDHYQPKISAFFFKPQPQKGNRVRRKEELLQFGFGMKRNRKKLFKVKN